MKRTDELQGRRLLDVEFRENYERRGQEQPGDYYRVLSDPQPYPASNLTGETWYIVTPNGLHGSLHNHTVREEADGTITVKPGDGSSNSILVSHRTPEGDKTWHGYITNGLWWSLEAKETQQ